MASIAPLSTHKRTNSPKKARDKLGRLLSRRKEPGGSTPLVQVSPPPPEQETRNQSQPAATSPTTPDALKLPELEDKSLLDEVDSSQADAHLHNESYSLALAAYCALLAKLSPSSPQRPLLRLHKTDCLLNLNKFIHARDEADAGLREIKALEAAQKAQRRKSSGGEGLWVGGGLERNGSIRRASGEAPGRRMSLDGAVGLVRSGSVGGVDWGAGAGGSRFGELERKLKDRREIARRSGRA